MTSQTKFNHNSRKIYFESPSKKRENKNFLPSCQIYNYYGEKHQTNMLNTSLSMFKVTTKTT